MTQKKLPILLLIGLLSSFTLKAQLNNIYGSYWTGTEEIFTSMDMTTGIFTDIDTLTGVQSLNGGESTFDPDNGHYIRLTNLGVTVVDIQTGAIVNTFLISSNVKGIEYDPASSKLYGSYWTGTEEIFTSMDMTTGILTDIDTLTGVQSLNSGESTFDPDNGHYIRLTNLGVTVVDIQTGAIVNTFSNSSNVKGIEYDPTASKLYGSYWTGTEEIFTSMDMTTGILTDIDTLTGVQSLNSGESTFDPDNGHYIRLTNLGVTVVDIQTGAIVNAFSNSSNVKGIEFQYCFNSEFIEQITVSTASICESDSSLLSVATTYNSYLWSNGDTSSSIYITDSANYSVVLTNDLGCQTSSNSVSISIYDCSLFIDSLTYNVDTCLIDYQTVTFAFINNISIINDTVWLEWYFITSNGDTLNLDADYYFNQNGVYCVIIALNCSDKKAQVNSYFDLIEINHVTTGTADLSSIPDISFFPNPTNDIVFIDFNNTPLDGYLEVYSMQGQRMKTVVLQNTENLNLDFTAFESGIYFINLFNGQEFKVFKIVKK